MNTIDAGGMRGITDRRLRADVDELLEMERRSGGRMSVRVAEAAGRVMGVEVRLDRVRTSFKDRRTGEFVFHHMPVAIEIDPHVNAEGGVGYPLIRPGVRILFPGLPGHLVPASAGLLWIDPAVILRDLAGQMGLAGVDLAGLEDGSGTAFGQPCLWRAYRPSFTLSLAIRNSVRLLVDGRLYSPRNCLNVEVATFMALHSELWPLDRDLGWLLDERQPEPGAPGGQAENPRERQGDEADAPGDDRKPAGANPAGKSFRLEALK